MVNKITTLPCLGLDSRLGNNSGSLDPSSQKIFELTQIVQINYRYFVAKIKFCQKLPLFCRKNEMFVKIITIFIDEIDIRIDFP